jgi:hypothetical protein
MFNNNNPKRFQASKISHRSNWLYAQRFCKCAIDKDQLEFPIKSWSNHLKRLIHKNQVICKQRHQAIPFERTNDRHTHKHEQYDPNTIVEDYDNAKSEKKEMKKNSNEISNIRIVDISKQVRLMFDTIEVAMERGEAIGTDEIRESWKSINNK